MTSLSPTESETLTLDSPSIFLRAYRSSISSQQTTPPGSVESLARGYPLSPIPSGFPHLKLIPNTRFVVDGFRSAGDFSISYFLSHFHSDHYTGLSSGWCKGIIYCTETTSRLLINCLGVPPPFVVSLPLGRTAVIDGCEVTAIDANHCPGAAQFLFSVPASESGQWKSYVHTGDFRYCESMKSDPALCQYIGADAVFLDTTYCNPKYAFPSQDKSIEYVASTIEKVETVTRESSSERVLFLIATYVVGKERILLEVSRRCNCVLHVDGKKMGVLRSLGYGDSGIFTEDASATNVHVIGWNLLGETWPYFRPNFSKLKEMAAERGYSKAVGFVPSGWMYETKKDGFSVRVKDAFEIHLVPYSEHSSYSELREYIRFLRPKRVIPTVGFETDKLDSTQHAAFQKHFSALIDQTANKHEFLKVFHRRTRNKPESEGDPEPQVERDRFSDDTQEGSDLIPISFDCVPDSNLQTPITSDEIMEEAVEELRGCLPSWVTKKQMLVLLSRSNNDIVGAVSEFYERETEFFEEAKPSISPIPQMKTAELFETSQFGASQNRNTKPVFGAKSSIKTNAVLEATVSPRKRTQVAGTKARKKAKQCAAESHGYKQSTITKFFGKTAIPIATTLQDAVSGKEASDQQVGNSKEMPDTSTGLLDEELHRFLNIINGSLSSSEALSFLEKTKGNINAALDLYYSSASAVSVTPSTCISQVHCQDGLENSVHDDKAVSLVEKPDAASINILGNLNENRGQTPVYLPLEKYSPIEHACWKHGQPAPYLHLARTFDLVEREKGKIKTTNMLCNMFRSLLALSPEDLLASVYLCTNKIAPDYENMELNVGFGTVTSALEEACGISRSKIRELYSNLGDLGDVAQMCRQNQLLLAPPRPLSISSLFSSLRSISMETGSGSAARKKNIIVALMRSSRENEIKFIVRTLIRNLRIGAMLRTILPSLAQATVLNGCLTHDDGFSENLKEKLQLISTTVVDAYNLLPNLDMLVPSLLSKGIHFSPSSLSVFPGMPIPSMLARITNGVPEVLKSFQNRAFTCEYKYDGQRAQIHKLKDGSIRVFSRNMNDMTSKYPDLVNAIQELSSTMASNFIIDAEVVAVDRKNKLRIMPFQHLSSRERGGKSSIVSLDNIKVDVCIFVFDAMLFNGVQLLAYPLRRRREYLKNMIQSEKPGYLEFAKEMTVEAERARMDDEETLAKVHSFLEEACKSSCEGIMVKSLEVDAGYAASKRTESWLKVKRDYVEGLGDSLDLVPIGAWRGNGRKAKWYSPFLLACYNHETEEFQSVCRVMTGFSDSFYAEMKEFYSEERILPKKPTYYATDENPELWFSAELVWEIRGAEFTISPVHHAAVGLIHPSRGISMRFPRYIRTVPDRKPEECSSATDIAEMFSSQPRRMEDKTD